MKWRKKNRGLLSCQKIPDILQVHIPLWHAHLSPHVSHVRQHMWSSLRHRQLLISAVFSGHSGGFLLRGFHYWNALQPRCSMPQLCRVLLLALSCLVFAIMFGFPGSLLTAFSGGTLANGINQLLFLKASFCLRREQKEDPNENQPGLRQHRRCMVKQRGSRSQI